MHFSKNKGPKAMREISCAIGGTCNLILVTRESVTLRVTSMQDRYHVTWNIHFLNTYHSRDSQHGFTTHNLQIGSR
jgi:hypothetical protein